MDQSSAPHSRRTFLRLGSAGVAASGIVASAALDGLPAAAGNEHEDVTWTGPANPVVAENRLTDPSTWSDGYILGRNLSSAVEGFARRASVNAGEPVELVISGPNRYLPPGRHEPVETVEVELYRLGYYGGEGARLVWRTPGPVSTWQAFDDAGRPANTYHGGAEPADHPSDPSTGLRGQAGHRTTVVVPGSACTVSGVYLAKLVGRYREFPPQSAAIDMESQSHVVFVVRDDARPRDVLAVVPTNTWQAYNYWGGRSLYTYNSRYTLSGSIVPATGTERAAKVSLDRPYNNWIGDFNWVLRTEFPAIWWLEQQGYDVAYTEDVAFTFDPGQALPARSKAVALLGHGEYWTDGIRDGLESARDAGTAIYNFGANTGYWRVRYETAEGAPATTADEARVLVCFKTVEGGGTDLPAVPSEPDPVSPTTTWRDPGYGPGRTPENTPGAVPAYAGPDRAERSLLGVQYIGDDASTDRPLVVPADNGRGEFAGHRAWRHTRVAGKGGRLGTNLVGWEWDGVPADGQPFNGAAPTVKPGTRLQRLSQTDPREQQTADLVYLQDAGRAYATHGPGAEPPPGWTPYVNAITYTAPSGALVFSAGTIHWSWGLGPHHLDRVNDNYSMGTTDSSVGAIRQATANLLADGGIRPLTPSGVVLDPDGDEPRRPAGDGGASAGATPPGR